MVFYVKGIVDMLGINVIVVVVNVENVFELGFFGVLKVLEVFNDLLKNFNVEVYVSIVV